VNYAIIGDEVVKNLFKGEDPVNKKISFYGSQFVVIGVLEKKGGFGGDTYADRTVFIPVKTAIRTANRGYLDYRITVSVKDPTKMDYAVGEATSLMRKIRRDRIGAEESFEVSVNKTLEEELKELTSYLRIGGFSIGFHYPGGCVYRPDEYYAGFCYGAYKGDWCAQSYWRHTEKNTFAVSHRSHTDMHHGRYCGCNYRTEHRKYNRQYY
jgi:hypothetical protein